MGRLLHRIAHLFGMNGCTLGRAMVGGHEWIFTVCAGCGERKPFAHSIVCDCKEAAHG